MRNEILLTLEEEIKRNRALASVATEEPIRADYLRKAELFEAAVILIREPVQECRYTKNEAG